MRNVPEAIEKAIVYQNKWIKIHEHKVLNVDGSEGLHAFMETSGGGSVLPIYADGSVFLSSEYKYALGKYSLEVFSGGRKAGENPIDAVKRELLEELGAEAQEWEYWGLIHPYTSFCNSPNHMFIAKQLRFSQRMLDEGELLEIVRMDLKDAVNRVLTGEITHAASCVILLRAARVFGV